MEEISPRASPVSASQQRYTVISSDNDSYILGMLNSKNLQFTISLWFMALIVFSNINMWNTFEVT